MFARRLGTPRGPTALPVCSCSSFLFTPALPSPNQLRLLSTTPRLSNKAKGKRRAKDPIDQFYSDSLNLPKTAFPLRAEANRREKLFWNRTTDSLYQWQKEQTDRPLFVLHDGPPYANGNLHCGHALNKITKDLINRSKLMQGYRVHYTPGFDTHGLPLELKALAALDRPASSLSPQQIRRAARKEAEKGIRVQTGEFKTFAVMGDWEHPYRTMDWGYEKRQLEVVRDMVKKGLIVSHHRPTLYSPSSRTALAEAELEYRDDHVSRSVYVSFPVQHLGAELHVELERAGVRLGPDEQVGLAVWTTTAWTIPSNVAVAVSPDMRYSLVRPENSPASLLIVATERIAALSELLDSRLDTLASFLGYALLSTTYHDPLSSTFASPPRPIIPADYVTATTGTGLVHTAPAHGVEDWEAWRSYHVAQREEEEGSRGGSAPPPPDTLCAVDAAGKLDGTMRAMGLDEDVVQRLIGKEVLGDGTAEVIRLLEERGRLLKEVEVEHKFPYDWRTKQPVIYRASSQWFANLDPIKMSAIDALENVKFYPARGAKTLEMYVLGRSEWCISRQRAWGVPIPVLYSSSPEGGREVPLLTPPNVDHIVRVLSEAGKGTDYWWDGSAEEFVEPAELERARSEGRTTWRKGMDTLDVWFDSGCSWTLLREEGLQPAGGGPVADVYFEGSDQHRGWFQSSLLTSIASSEPGQTPTAPYKDVVTHGMVLDDKGRKMSKSLGNIVSPKVVIDGGKDQKLEPAYGTDLLRIWVASVDSSRDVLIGPGILSQTFEGLRKIRNTARFILGNIAGQLREDFKPEELGLIERYILHELYELDQSARKAFGTYQFNKAYQALSTFSNTTLSAFYFDVTKDSLYADSHTSLARQHVVHVLQKVFDTYLAVLAPMAPLLAEEIHHFAQGRDRDPSADEVAPSVFEKGWPEPASEWNAPKVKASMVELLGVRDAVNGLLEQARNDKRIGSSAEAAVVIDGASETLRTHAALLPKLLIVSDVKFTDESDPTPTAELAWKYEVKLEEPSSTSIAIGPGDLAKCRRCWQYTVEVSSSPEPVPSQEAPAGEPRLCGRCEDVLAERGLIPPTAVSV
ncbi:isoleucyl-tRNA synthetase [Rhodotorula sp. JG-1b]|nr:isoleucyl-tRNA synthetase [Rhodotorula sp. JG-1b]